MKTNMGFIDRVLRFALAAVFVALYLTGTVTGTLGIVLIVVAVIFAGTSMVSICPLYNLFGIKTCSAKKA
jgi:hypothetical protein